MPKYYLLFLLLLSVLPLRAQKTEVPECQADALHRQCLLQDTAYARKFLETENRQTARLREKYRQKPLTGKPSSLAAKTPALYTIPVVVHIIHNGGSENISDAQVQAGIQHLNDAFRLQPPYDGPLGADVEIEFCLARQDEFGNPSTGINRVLSPLTDHNSSNDLALKNLSRWDSRKYLNIWLVKEICMPSYGCSVAGYAYYASAHGSLFDGVVNEARWFGSSTNGSKIHVHEVGHYLNLRHTFNGGCPNDDCLVQGDAVCDTPPDDSKAGVACGSSVNTCFTDDDDLSLNNPFRPTALGGLGDQPDMHQNYMDYGFQSCQNAFTAGQKDRMLDALTNIRSSLLSSLGCENPCLASINLDITASSPATIPLGTTVNFSNATTGAGGYTWDWRVNGVSQASTPDFSYLFGATGLFEVQLVADNGNISCRKDTTIRFEVVCPAFSVGFNTSQNDVIAGTTVNFANTTTGSNTYEWFVNGLSQDITTDFAFTFNTQGTYVVQLMANNAATGCSYAAYDTVRVNCPVQAFFAASATDVLQNAVVVFSNTSLNASNYVWKIDGVVQTTTPDFSFTFNALGDFAITLLADNGICTDSVSQIINVSDPAQCTRRQADLWYFGFQAGLDFRSGAALPIFNGQMFAEEGCATVSNEFGNLLFYSNGEQIWNRDHALMPNGSGLMGDVGATQSVQIVPKPGNPAVYYVFTTDKEGEANGLRYSEVNMALDAGRGEVEASTKNVLLQSPVAEKLTAVMHGNNCDVWVLAHGWGDDAFYAYLVTENGVNASPVISNFGTPIGKAAGSNQVFAGGQMKVSPNGHQLALAARAALTPTGGNSQVVELFDFDNFTGEVSNPLTLSSTASPNNALFNPYGIEFSPDGTKLYVTAIFDGIYQYDLQAGSPAAIISSRASLTLSSALQAQYYALQLAPDRKIYVAPGFSTELGVIENPNEALPTASFTLNGLNVSSPDRGGDGPNGLQGLPGLIPNLFQQLDFDYACNGTEISFFLRGTTAGGSFDNLRWEFGEPSSGSDNFSDQTNPRHNYAGMGPYTVTLQVKDNCVCTFVQKEISIDPLCLITLQDRALTLNAQARADYLVWLNATRPADLSGQPWQLERSPDGQTFVPIAALEHALFQSQYQDKEALLHTQPCWYYRIKTHLPTGAALYSPVVALHWPDETWQLAPQPAAEGQALWLLSNAPDQSLRVQWRDVRGRYLGGQTLNRQEKGFPLRPPFAAAGLYLLEIWPQSGPKVLKVWWEK
ncbi:MAG: PKD domain-containing protein [Microscillaceae bacterium]|nr:PKD domain-containing protein [Microscillaceae bacterium]